MGKNNVAFSTVPKEKKWFSFLAVFMMLGNVYVFPPLPVLAWGEIILIIFIPYFITKLKGKLIISKNECSILLFALYGFILTIVMGAVMQAEVTNIATRIARDFFYYFIIIFLGTKILDKDLFFRLLNIFCTVLGVYVIIQSLLFTITGYYLPGFLLNVRINDGNHMGSEIYSNYLSYARIAGYLRPNGFLCEPAHCAQCLFIDLIILLFDEKQKEKRVLLNAGLVSLGALLTMSTSAVVYIAVTWILWMIKEGKRNILKVIGWIMMIGLIVITAYSRGNLTNFISVTRRLTDAFSGNSISNSASLRLAKGFDVYSNLPIQYQIFGIGFGTYASALNNSILASSMSSIGNEYMNSFSYILVSSGMVGGLILLGAFTYLLKKSDAVGKVTILALFIVSLGSSIYSSPFCVWAMLIILNSTISNRIGAT